MERATFTITLQRNQPPAELWQRLWDLRRHSAAIPLTTVASPADQPLGAGAHFCARTAIGPFGFDDRMVVRQWQPPHLAVIEKIGPLLFGTITVQVISQPAGATLLWLQSYSVAKMPDILTKPTAPLIRRGYLRSLEKILT